MVRQKFLSIEKDENTKPRLQESENAEKSSFLEFLGTQSMSLL